MTTLTRPGHHRNDPRTSVEADFNHRASGKTETHQNLVLAEVRAQGGMCAEEIGERTGLGRVEAARRLSDLKDRGLVERGERVTYGGSSQSTWTAIGGALTQGSLL